MARRRGKKGARTPNRILERAAARDRRAAQEFQPVTPRPARFLISFEETEGEIIATNTEFGMVRVRYERAGKREELIIANACVIEEN